MLFLKNINYIPLAIISTFSLLSASSALIVQIATSTSICHNNGLMHKSIMYATPRPTKIAELRVRQTQASLATCGFINGDGGEHCLGRKDLYIDKE